MKYVIALLIFCSTMVFGTEPQRWVGTPVFYSKYVPKVVDCEYNNSVSYGFCGVHNYPELGKMGLTTLEHNTPPEVLDVRLYTEVTCVLGQCNTQFGEPVGNIDTQGTSYWTVPTGFYLITVNRKTVAYKYGNGPLAKNYPIRGVQLIQGYDQPDGYYIPEEAERLTFNVHCNVSDECSYMGKVINYADLNKYVPKRLSTQCDVRFCYDTHQLIVGLNPRNKNVN